MFLIRNVLALLLVLSVVGCSGIKPWNPPNYREDGPTTGGLLSGPEGAWTIGFGGKTEPAGQPAAPATPEKKKNHEKQPPASPYRLRNSQK